VTVEAPPAVPPQPPVQQPPSQNDGRGGFFGWIARKPKLAFWLTLAVALFIGIGIGSAGSSSSSDKSQLASAHTQASQARARANDAQGQVTALQGEVSDLRGQLKSANALVKRATAHGPVPDLTGHTVTGAKDAIQATGVSWHVKTTHAPSEKEPGTVIAQSPSEGTNLHAGRSITLTVAVPEPKQWRTLVNLSGAGEQRTNEFRIPAGMKARLNYSFSGGSNDIIQLKSPGQGADDFGDLLFNEIGSKQGTTRLYGSAGTRYLDIEGDSWSVQVQVFK
jgi:hypothetical protein